MEFYLASLVVIYLFVCYVDYRQNKKYKERELDDCIKDVFDIDEVDKNSEYN
jgi:hypothetical protein